MIRSIPKSVLIHSAVLYKRTGKNTKEQITYSDAVSLDYVCFQDSNEIIRLQNGDEYRLSGILFYDEKNSRPQGIEFSLDDKIVFNGTNYYIKRIRTESGFVLLHHFEIELGTV